jgi:hypothetical protein
VIVKGLLGLVDRCYPGCDDSDLSRMKICYHLEVIVSEVVQLVLTRQVLDRVRVCDDSVSSHFRKKIRSRVRENPEELTTCIHYHY